LDKHLFIHHRNYVLLHVYNACLARKTIKPKLFDLLLIEPYSKGERRPYNTNSQRTSNMLSNVFKCFKLISLPKKHDRLTYTRTVPMKVPTYLLSQPILKMLNRLTPIKWKFSKSAFSWLSSLKIWQSYT
jgi:hypothetical protein